MGTGAIPVVLTFLLVFFVWQVVFSTNRDLVRARAWGELGRRLLPFVAIVGMVVTLPLVQHRQEYLIPYAWVITFAFILVVANFFYMPLRERRANRAFRKGDYAGAAILYRKLVERHPLARYWSSLGAALGAGEQYEEGVDASTKAVELDPKYGLAYYNRALILSKMGRKSRAAKDYGEFLVRLLPLLSTGVFVLGLPFVMDLTIEGNAVPVLLVYLAGAAVLTVIMARLAAPEERRAGALFRREEYEAAAAIYERLIARRPLPRYYSALGASLDASGDPRAALEATDTAVKLDAKLGIALYNRASALVALGEYTRAREDLRAISRADSNRRLRRAAEEAVKTFENDV
ncbi:MAG: tetratricopeptide repeat protein [Actinobacteria bacterium]|nr:tetratricopeptide repeat protein [Actinomycetota bacterium]